MRLVSDDLLGIVTLFQEAEGESYPGKVAVAEVILRRTARRYMSDGTVAGTVLRPFQFSGWNTGSTNRIRSLKLNDDDPAVRECIRAWNHAKAGSNTTGNAVHYFNPELCFPDWARGAEVVAEIGNHRFVIPKEE